MGDGALAGLRYSARNVLALLQRGGGEGVVAMVIWPCVYDHTISNLNSKTFKPTALFPHYKPWKK